MGVIYKITNPKGRIYIGQTVDFEVRLGRYKGLHCEGQPRLHNSLKKYGFDNHKFEVLEDVDDSELNCREAYWQVTYDVLSKSGMNCKIQGTKDKTGRASDKVREKISKSATGRRHTPEAKEKMRKAKLGKKMPDAQRMRMFGRKLPAAQVEKIRAKMIGNTYTVGVTPVNAKKVVDLVTGVVYPSAAAAARENGMKRTTLGAMLSGANRNRTSLRYL